MMDSNGPVGNSLANRISPLTNSTPASRSRGRFNSEPGRCKLSMAMTRVEGRRRFRNTDRKSTRLNSSHLGISYAFFCLKKKKKETRTVLSYRAVGDADVHGRLHSQI